MPLVTTKDMFKKAYEGHYAVGAFNVNNMEICFTSSRRPLKIRICPLPSILTMVLISKSAKPVLMAVLRPS